jgi:hypothetical protein
LKKSLKKSLLKKFENITNCQRGGAGRGGREGGWRIVIPMPGNKYGCLPSDEGFTVSMMG